MTLVHLHLLLNHIPVIGVPIAGLLLVLGIVRHQRVLVRTALALMAAFAVAAVAVFLTGEPAEDAVEHLPGIVDQMIDRHEDIATGAVWAAGFLGLVGLAGLFLSRQGRPVPRAVAFSTVVLMLVAAGLLGATGYTGGQIRHTEIRSTATVGVIHSDEAGR